MIHEAPRRRRPPPRNLRRRRLIAAIVALVVVFLLGLAFGQALDDNPDPGENRTFVRTFEPFAPQRTVTVTTTVR